MCLSQAQKEQERGVRENVRVKWQFRMWKNGVNNKDNRQPATSTSAQPPPLASISNNLQYSDFPVIQKFHFSIVRLYDTLSF
jgi:hypothetical protein